MNRKSLMGSLSQFKHSGTEQHSDSFNLNIYAVQKRFNCVDFQLQFYNPEQTVIVDIESVQMVSFTCIFSSKWVDTP